MKRAAVALALFAAACGSRPVAAPLQTQTDVATASADTDVADRDCRVVLRRADFLADRSTGMVVTIDVAESLLADPGATPGVYFSADGGAWQEVSANPSDASLPPLGYKRFTALFSFLQSADFLAFARTTTGVRLFDHNRLPGDFDSFHATLGSSVAEAPSVCTGERPIATLTFNGGWTEQQHGAIVAGDQLEVDYDLGRLGTCRATHDGYRFWSLDAYAQFQPSGQIVSGSVVASNGATVSPAPFVTDVPAGTTSVALWFHNYSPDGCDAWDSNYGANYVYPVVATATAPIGWLSGVGGSTDRACQHADTLEDPIVIDEYARERACLFADVDVWLGGVTDGNPAHPEYVLAQVEWAKDAAAPTDTWLDDVGIGSGTSQRFRWQLPYELRNMADWTTATYSLRVSVDGRTWTYAEGGKKRTIQRAFTLPQ